MKELQQRTLLVTGASGHLGRLVVDCLLEAGAKKVIAATRMPEKIADLKERGAEVRHADFDDPAMLRDAFSGANRILIISTDAIRERGRRLQQQRSAVDAAVQAGAKHVTYTSFLLPTSSKPQSILLDHYETEQALAGSGLDYTALRFNRFMDGLRLRVPSILQQGKMVGMEGNGGISYISRQDCARDAAAVLLSEQPPQGIVDVTGAEAISNEKLMELLGEVVGREVPYVGLSEAAYREHLVANGTSQDRVSSAASGEISTARGDYGLVTNTVEELTGKPPMRVREFLASFLTGPGSVVE